MENNCFFLLEILPKGEKRMSSKELFPRRLKLATGGNIFPQPHWGILDRIIILILSRLLAIV